MDGCSQSRGAVRVRIVREARDRGRSHGQDAQDEDGVGGSALVKEVKQDHAGEQADGDVGDRGVKRVAQPGPVEEVLRWTDRPEERHQPAMIEIAKRLSPRRLGIHEASKESGDHGVTSAGSP